MAVDPARLQRGSLSSEIGSRIRQARESRGLTQTQLAAALAVSQAAVSSLEAGGRPIRVDDLVVLSQVLGRDLDYFLAPTRAERPPVGVTLRAEVAMLAVPEYREAVNSFLDEVDLLPLPQARASITPRSPEASAREARSVGRQARRPINVDAVAQRLGVSVFKRPFPEALSALIIRHGDGAVIGVNSNHPSVRQRFSAAHELGHFALHHESQHFVEFGVPLADQGEPPGYDWQNERSANIFAAELLMPADQVADDAPDYSLRRLSQLYKVSEAAMGFRLANLRLRATD